MIQIGDVVVSLDVFQEKFLCDLGACKGACCIEGDAGAPVELDEVMELEEVLPVIWDELASEARAVIEKQGVVYTDQEGDLVTSIVNNKDCVFTCYDESWPAAALSDLCSSVTPSPLSRLRPWLPPPEFHGLQYHHGQRRRLNAGRESFVLGTVRHLQSDSPVSLMAFAPARCQRTHAMLFQRE